MSRLRLEPRGPVALGRKEASTLARVGATAGATTMAITSTGDVLALAALLGVLAGDVVVGATTVLAALATFARWGTPSLADISGAQAVLGPGIATGSAFAALSTALAAAALIVASPSGWLAAAYGVTAALLVSGPSPSGGVLSWALRVGAAVTCVALASAAAKWLPHARARWAGLGLAAGALGSALL